MAEGKFPIGEATLCTFRGFRHKVGDSWEYIQASYQDDKEVWLNATFWKPNKEKFTNKKGEVIELGTLEEQTTKLFNKLSHLLEPFGVNKKDLSTDGDFEALYNTLREAAKNCIGKKVYVKTMPSTNRDGVELGSWFPITSTDFSKLEYSEVEQKRIQTLSGKKEAATEDKSDDFDDLPF